MKPTKRTFEAIMGEMPVVIIRGEGPVTREEREVLRRLDEAAARPIPKDRGDRE